MNRLRLGFLASHGGTNMQAILTACREGELNAEPRVIISNNAQAPALERGRNEGIPTFHISSRTHPHQQAVDEAILHVLQTYDVTLVILAGYMRMLGPQTLQFYKNRILNIHPALLPKFGGKGMYGKFVHEAVIAAKEEESGITIHLVDDKYDHGAIVAQHEIAVAADDTPESLQKRILSQEHVFFVQVLKKITTGEIDLDKIASHE